MENKDLQNLLDSLDEGPLGTRKDYQWDMVMRMKMDNIGSTPEAKEKIRKKRKENATIPITVYRILETIKDRNQIIDFKVEKVKDYPSVFKAAEELNVQASELRRIIHPDFPGSLSVKGYTVQRQGKELGGYKEKLAKRKRNTEVVVALKDGIEVGIFRNAFEAAKQLKLPITAVYGVLDPKNINKKECRGYTFKYQKLEPKV